MNMQMSTHYTDQSEFSQSHQLLSVEMYEFHASESALLQAKSAEFKIVSDVVGFFKMRPSPLLSRDSRTSKLTTVG